MINKDKLLLRPNYLLTRYQNEIFRQLGEYMEKNNLKKQDIAEALGVSNAYVSQILHGDFNFTLKKLIELGLLVGKVPMLEFVAKEEYWLIRKGANGQQMRSFTLPVEKATFNGERLKKIKSVPSENEIANKVKTASKPIDINSLELCLQ